MSPKVSAPSAAAVICTRITTSSNSRLSQVTVSLESRDASELLSPGPLPTALFHALMMDAAATTMPTDPGSKQQIRSAPVVGPTDFCSLFVLIRHKEVE